MCILDNAMIHVGTVRDPDRSDTFDLTREFRADFVTTLSNDAQILCMYSGIL